MKKTIFNVLLFTAGAAVGSAVTWYVVKTKYEQLIQEEIDSVKETWARLMSEETTDETVYDTTDDENEDNVDPDDDLFAETELIDYSRLAGMYKNSDKEVEKDEEGEGDDEVPSIDGPYVITPEDFADGQYEHDLYCLTYYSDGILANDWWEEIDIDETISRDALDHFGDYAEDIVHVRNKRLKADYEVVRDDRRYADLLANDPLLRPNAD